MAHVHIHMYVNRIIRSATGQITFTIDTKSCFSERGNYPSVVLIKIPQGEFCSPLYCIYCWGGYIRYRNSYTDNELIINCILDRKM